jgi:hypothetical protein
MFITVTQTYAEFVYSSNSVYRIPINEYRKYRIDNDKKISFGNYIINKPIETIKSITDTVASKLYNNFLSVSDIDAAIISTITPYTAPDPPKFSSGEVGLVAANKLTINFDSELDALKTDGAYAISASAGSATLSNPSISGSVLTLDISRNIAYGETISFSYTNSGTNPLQNSGNTAQVATFTTALIVNNVQQEIQTFENFINTDIGYESGNILTSWSYGANSGDWVNDCIANPVFNGAYAHRASVAYNGGARCRAEVTSRDNFGGGRNGYLPWHTEFWMGVAIYLPDYDGKIGTGANNGWATIVQMHGVPNGYNWGNGGPTSNFLITAQQGNRDGMTIGYPVVYIMCNTDNWIQNYHQDGSYYKFPANPGWGASLPLPVPAWYIDTATAENKWLRIVANFVISPDNDGFMKFWVDDQLVINETGPNQYYYDYSGEPATQECLLQVGVYKDPDSSVNITHYYDDLKLAGSDGYYDAVAPRISSSPIFVSGEVGNINSQTIDVTFSDTLWTGRTDGTHSITASGGAVVVNSATVFNEKLRLELDRVIGSFETITYAYTTGGALPLQDTEGVIVETFTAQPITNNVSGDILGIDLVSNGTFGSWTGIAPNDTPDNWNIIGGSATSYITQNPAGECQFIAGPDNIRIEQQILTPGDTYRLTIDVTDRTSGSVGVGSVSGEGDVGYLNAVGSYTLDFVAIGDTLCIKRGSTNDNNITIDNVTVKKVLSVQNEELLTNNTFSNWSLDDPLDWTVIGESGSDPMVTEAIGGDAARIYTSNALVRLNYDNCMEIGKSYTLQFDVTERISGGVNIGSTSGGEDVGYAIATGTYQFTFTALGTVLSFKRRVTNPNDITITNVSLRESV